MKPGCFYSIICLISVSAVIFFFTGCPRPVGKCTYGGALKPVFVKVKSVEKIKSDAKIQVQVKIEGFLKEILFLKRVNSINVSKRQL
jgi:hypothetical protein